MPEFNCRDGCTNTRFCGKRGICAEAQAVRFEMQQDQDHHLGTKGLEGYLARPSCQHTDAVLARQEGEIYLRARRGQ